MKFVIITSFLCALITAGCGSTPQANANNSAVNGVSNTRLQNVDPKDLPPGLSASPLAPANGTAPGIDPANAVNSAPKGATPTPGIPDPASMNKPQKPGATPTPGIPDPATMKKQMEEIKKRLNSNANQAPPPPPPPPGASDGQMMRKQRKIANANN